ncbi:MAG: DUF2937 family protein [Sulfitobacter sp.]
MILRALTLVGGLAGAATTAQFPEFSQQYIQRLGGAVDALSEVAADFDVSADAAGLTRDAALAQMQGTQFLERRRTDMTNTFTRLESLQSDLRALQGQGPFMRAYHLPRFRDPQIAGAAWQVFVPALPLSFAGISFALLGFVLATLGLGLILRILTWPFRRRAATSKPA